MTSWKFFADRVEERVEVNDALGATLLRRISNRTPRYRLMLFIFKPVLALGVIAAVVIFAPRLQPNTTSPTSFIQQAIAESQAKAEAMDASTVRHIVIIDNKNLGNGVERDIWMSADGQSYFETDTGLSDETRVLDGIYADVNDQHYVTPEYYAAEVERQADRTHRPAQFYPDEPMLHFTLPAGATAMGSSTRTTETGWIACQASTMGLASALEGQAVEQRVGELLGFGQRMNVVPNFADAIAVLADSALVLDMGEKIVDDIGLARVYRLSYQDTAMHDYAAIITVGTDYIFDAQTKELKEITHWYKDPEEYNEGRSTMRIVTDEIIPLSSLAVNPLDPTANGLVLAPVDDYVEKERQQRIDITLPADGCYSIKKEDFSFEKIADSEEEARTKGFFE